MLVGVIERVGDLVQHRDGFLKLETLALLENRVETLALEQLHGVPQQLTAGADAVDRDDVRVVEGGGGAGFAPEPLDGALAKGERGWEHFDGDTPA